jgi:hypothetical protein
VIKFTHIYICPTILPFYNFRWHFRHPNQPYQPGITGDTETDPISDSISEPLEPAISTSLSAPFQHAILPENRTQTQQVALPVMLCISDQIKPTKMERLN